jgi:polysaccharide export outer membrane protein
MIKNTLRSILFLIFIVITFSACNTEKPLLYFQPSSKHSTDTVNLAKYYVPKIHTGDILSIYVNSLSPEASSFFNPYSANSSGSSNALSASSTNGQVAPTGYLVDSEGEIELPLLGNIKISGYTTTQVRDTLKKKLALYLKEPTVLVRFTNFKISILGEVSHPDVYNISNESITLPEAISMAGDLTIYAKRDSIEIIRDVDGKKVFANVNFQSRDVFNSPYYYLHANDIVYVKPAKTKTQQTDRSFEFASIGFSLISLLLIIFRN